MNEGWLFIILFALATPNGDLEVRKAISFQEGYEYFDSESECEKARLLWTDQEMQAQEVRLINGKPVVAFRSQCVSEGRVEH